MAVRTVACTWKCWPNQLMHIGSTSRITFSCERKLSTSRPNDKVYELRTYAIYPKDVKPYLDLSKEWMHIRTGHSKLVGYWTAELGAGINDMVHIWEYDSLSHRAEVRKNLAGDPAWVANYFSKILPWLQRQENSVLKCLPGTDIIYPPENGTYELVFLNTSHSPESTASAVKDITRSGATLVGSWYNTLSQPGFAWLLWFHKDINNATNSTVDIPTESGVKIMGSKILLPTPWSTMK